MVLPTGKNIHALDPQSIPTQAALKSARIVVERCALLPRVGLICGQGCCTGVQGRGQMSICGANPHSTPTQATLKSARIVVGRLPSPNRSRLQEPAHRQQGPDRVPPAAVQAAGDAEGQGRGHLA